MKQPPLRSLGLILAVAGSVSAQGSAGSESGVVLSHHLMSAGGDSITGTNNLGFSSVGQTLAGVVSTSTNFELLTGVSWTLPEVTTDQPLIFGIREGAGPGVGGTPIDVFGFNFTQPAAGPLDLEFNGSLASSTAVVSNIQASSVTPTGLNGFGNPLAEVDVDAFNLLGSMRMNDGYNYFPALSLEVPATVGGPLAMRLQTNPGDLYFLALGKSITGFGLAIPPWDGQLELILNVQILQSTVPVPFGVSLFQITIPDDPALAGGTLEFQAFSVTSFAPAEGRLSNLRSVFLNP
ncbi:MAG: hypothetical protein AAF682_30670 [Planctomycetota bacterium]